MALKSRDKQTHTHKKELEIQAVLWEVVESLDVLFFTLEKLPLLPHTHLCQLVIIAWAGDVPQPITLQSFNPVQRLLIHNGVLEIKADNATMHQGSKMVPSQLRALGKAAAVPMNEGAVIICRHQVIALAKAPMSRGDCNFCPLQHAAKEIPCFLLSLLTPDWREEEGHQASISSFSFIWWIVLRAF